MQRPFECYFLEPGNRRFKALQENQTLAGIYAYMCLEENVHKMVGACALGRPALEAVILGIEENFPFNGEFDLVVDFRCRQILGSICRFILHPEGYYPLKAVKMKKGHHIKSATIYRKRHR